MEDQLQEYILVDDSDQVVDDNGQISAYEYVQMCYEAEEIPLDLLEEVFPTVDFLVATTASAFDDDLYYDQSSSNYADYYQSKRFNLKIK